MDIFKSDELFREGKVAMNPTGSAWAKLRSIRSSKVSDKLVFGLMPGLRGADGKIIRW
jgi:multiple sugar transport system substrate-binding protein